MRSPAVILSILRFQSYHNLFQISISNLLLHSHVRFMFFNLIGSILIQIESCLLCIVFFAAICNHDSLTISNAKVQSCEKVIIFPSINLNFCLQCKILIYKINSAEQTQEGQLGYTLATPPVFMIRVCR